MPPHAREAARLDDALELGRNGGRLTSRRAEKLRDLDYRRSRIRLHLLVSQEQNVVGAGELLPRNEMLEVIAEIDLTANETLEEILERTVREFVMPREAARVVKERYDTIERIARDMNIARRAHRARACAAGAS